MAEGGLDQTAVRARLGTAAVGIIGLGGLGSNAAMMLLRSGVRRLVLADFDVVEECNLNRQLYTPDHLGSGKPNALATILKGIDPAVEPTLVNERITRENLTSRFGGVDVLIEAVDTAEGKAELVAAACELLPDVPLIWAMGLAGYASANRIRTQRIGDNVWVVGDLEADVREGLPLLAPRVMTAAAHEAHMAVRILLGEREA